MRDLLSIVKGAHHYVLLQVFGELPHQDGARQKVDP